MNPFSRILPAALLVLVGCAGGERSEELGGAHVAALETRAACGAVFTPDIELLEETRSASARWSAATGCDVRVGDGGIPVHLVEVLVDDEGNALPEHLVGGFHRGELAIYLTSLRDADTVTHEVGHALFPGVDTEAHPGGHLEPEPGAACQELMCPDGGSGKITATDLALVCEGFPCTAFAPEG